MCPFHTIQKKTKSILTQANRHIPLFIYYLWMFFQDLTQLLDIFISFIFLTLTWHIGHLYIKVVQTVWICICRKVKNCFCGMFRLWDFFILICSFGMSWFAYIFFFLFNQTNCKRYDVCSSFFHINHFFHKYTLIIRSVSSSKNNMYNGEKLAIFKSIHAIPLKLNNKNSFIRP